MMRTAGAVSVLLSLRRPITPDVPQLRDWVVNQRTDHALDNRGGYARLACRIVDYEPILSQHFRLGGKFRVG